MQSVTAPYKEALGDMQQSARDFMELGQSFFKFTLFTTKSTEEVWKLDGPLLLLDQAYALNFMYEHWMRYDGPRPSLPPLKLSKVEEERRRLKQLEEEKLQHEKDQQEEEARKLRQAQLLAQLLADKEARDAEEKARAERLATAAAAAAAASSSDSRVSSEKAAAAKKAADFQKRMNAALKQQDQQDDELYGASDVARGRGGVGAGSMGGGGNDGDDDLYGDEEADIQAGDGSVVLGDGYFDAYADER